MFATDWTALLSPAEYQGERHHERSQGYTSDAVSALRSFLAKGDYSQVPDVNDWVEVHVVGASRSWPSRSIAEGAVSRQPECWLDSSSWAQRGMVMTARSSKPSLSRRVVSRSAASGLVATMG